jgi:2'-5' RNA ligase
VNSSKLWEGCLAYAVHAAFEKRVLDLRTQILIRHPEAPAHLQLPPHVTVKYLGHQPFELQQRLLRDLRALTPASCVLPVNSVGSFTSAGGTLNLHLRLDSHPALLSLQEQAAIVLSRLGCIDLDRHTGERYQPHITVCDGLSPTSLDEDLELLETLPGQMVELKTLVLLRKPVAEDVLPETVDSWSALP